ncbi:LysR family transcriptional regulator [Bradyrhizobium sp. AUGA SZCCT0431]|uniref:LysR family transcriptional regulator n=1 Tax=Bradyrhizobium sp. AUGA SZCCT0431 TaxID=2807674 RepID=UPI001BACF1E2|nr:LysR family transcriptional regulator [Bradyrhizobium sp. AUGA SZCCT0431]MBR1147731.1 LysR family transcriptional regulator [Bradyrhizobium sp. AUGA SZCCT0431]
MEPSLRYFMAVAHSRSVNGAATELRIAASAISRQITKLENELGVRLFERKAYGVELTPAGEVYLRHARNTKLAIERVVSELDDLKELRSGLVRICSIEGIVGDLLTRAIVTFRELYPGIEFSVTVKGTAQVPESVANSEADIGIAFHPQPDEAFTTAFRIRDPLFAVMAPDHPASGRKRLSLAELIQYPIAVPESVFGIRQLIDTTCKANGLHLRPMVKTNSIEALRAFARQNGGVTVLPRLSIERDLKANTLVKIPLTDPILTRAFFEAFTLRLRPLPIASERFLKHLSELVRAIDR